MAGLKDGLKKMPHIITSINSIGRIVTNLNSKNMYVSRYECDKKVIAIHFGIKKISYISRIYKCNETNDLIVALGPVGWLTYNHDNNTLAKGTICKVCNSKISEITLEEHSEAFGCAVENEIMGGT